MADNNNDLERFDAASPIIFCGRCLTHFASLLEECTIDLTAQQILIPQPHVINLEIQHDMVYCRGCNMEMGNQIPEHNPDNAAIEGSVSLNLNMPLLQFWNGHDIFSFMVHLPMHALPLPPPYEHDPPFFLCKICNTHVAWMQGLFGMDLLYLRIFFSDYTELVVEPPGHHYLHQNGTTTLAFVHCSGCNEVLGMELVREDNPLYGFREGIISLDMTLLKIWNGTGHQLFSLMGRLPMLYRLQEYENPDDQPPGGPGPPPPPPPSNGHLPLPPPPLCNGHLPLPPPPTSNGHLPPPPPPTTTTITSTTNGH